MTSNFSATQFLWGSGSTALDLQSVPDFKKSYKPPVLCLYYLSAPLYLNTEIIDTHKADHE